MSLLETLKAKIQDGYEPTKEEIEQVLEELGLTIESTFIPWSRSRNYVESEKKDPYNLSLNYKVALLKNGRPILIDIDYGMGIFYSNTYQKIGVKGIKTVNGYNDLKDEVEKGYTLFPKETTKNPDIVDFIYSIVMDCDVRNYESFEDWARSVGYDDDSRKAEKIYQECLKTYMKVKKHLDLDFLQDLFRNY